MAIRMISRKGNIFLREKHNPSGIIIAWLGDDGKPHTKSIPRDKNVDSQLASKLTILHANQELWLKQLDLMSLEGIKSMPVMCLGLTRSQAKQALLEEQAKIEKIKLLTD